MCLLVTGGAGYIGSHTVVELLGQGHEVVILDSLVNSYAESVRRIEKISGKTLRLIEGDIRDGQLLDALFKEYDFSAVLHFAGLKAVGESVSDPLRYYDFNVNGSISLLQAMEKAGVKTIVFSSSATVYGTPEVMPVSESCPAGTPVNPYGKTKLITEEILRDLYAADSEWKVALLRYFNPVGAHESGLLGEDPGGTPSNLIPVIARAAMGKLAELQVFGGDYPTPDGTGMRDYIHVADLATGHVAALKAIQNAPGIYIWNLGTGRAYSVLEMIQAFEHASGLQVAYKISPRRSGDIATCYADPSRAEKELGWKAQKNLTTMMDDVWRWYSNNPNGYSA